MGKKLKVSAGICVLMGLLAAAAGCSSGQEQQEYGFSFRDMTDEAGIGFVHEKPVYDAKVDNIMPWLASTGAGVFVADFNQDGWMDLYFTNSGIGSKNALYRNNGDGTFTEVGDAMGVADVNQAGVSQTALWFDYDNDGYPDLFVGTWSEGSRLFRNLQGEGFADVTDETGIGKVNGNFAKAVALDYNRDGYLDLYLGAYFHEDHNLFDLTTTRIMHDDFERAVNGGRNILLRNVEGVFTDVSDEMGVADRGWTLAAGSADINNDGWPDLYNANDFGPDTLYFNEQGERFVEITQNRGIGEDTFKGMNVDFADVFHDGRLAMYVSNVSKPLYILEGNQLWQANEQGRFVDRGPELNIHLADFSWGARFMDIDNSGEFSLVVSTGFISASKQRDYWFDLGTLATTPGTVVEDAKNWMDFGDKSLSGYEQNYLFWNNGSSFQDVAAATGLTFDYDSRGVAAIDITNNGVLDLAFANQGNTPKLFANTVKPERNWIKLNLVGTWPSNRDAVGARVTFEVNGVSTVIERDGGNSYAAQSDPRIHFGLGTALQADAITIQWPSGRVQKLHNVAANQILTVEEPDEPIAQGEGEQP
ncbi:CRTAC1 family protein [Xylanibacillus composti]|uniref:CRTAC1 family protein n=1 Tax=Xylanibacillus composti TaxID=1572762 RepID=A0A8J4H924_9BACL|nr:CRTAC1 family protein [Xylanibacillus composti]MDT9726763.1 CRTAC1 family protein [Xylanibacillus composti]GIQ71469.1 CRTAC1 family protein [Xylanibacillus composti]